MSQIILDGNASPDDNIEAIITQLTLSNTNDQKEVDANTETINTLTTKNQVLTTRITETTTNIQAYQALLPQK